MHKAKRERKYGMLDKRFSKEVVLDKALHDLLKLSVHNDTTEIKTKEKHYEH